MIHHGIINCVCFSLEILCFLGMMHCIHIVGKYTDRRTVFKRRTDAWGDFQTEIDFEYRVFPGRERQVRGHERACLILLALLVITILLQIWSI